MNDLVTNDRPPHSLPARSEWLAPKGRTHRSERIAACIDALATRALDDDVLVASQLDRMILCIEHLVLCESIVIA